MKTYVFYKLPSKIFKKVKAGSIWTLTLWQPDSDFILSVPHNLTIPLLLSTIIKSSKTLVLLDLQPRHVCLA